MSTRKNKITNVRSKQKGQNVKRNMKRHQTNLTDTNGVFSILQSLFVTTLHARGIRAAIYYVSEMIMANNLLCKLITIGNR